MSGFNWDGETYTPGSEGGDFIGEEAFNKLIYTEAVVFITGVREGVGGAQYGSKPTWLVDFIDPAGEEFTKSFTKGIPERDARMLRFRATLEANPEDPIESSPVKVGRRKDFGPPKKAADSK